MVETYVDGFRRSDHAQVVGSPTITVTRMIEENDVVVAEGSVRSQRKAGGFLNAVFRDVFLMRGGKIRQLFSYLVQLE
jgi:ketosteroid isomerase-like protein